MMIKVKFGCKEHDYNELNFYKYLVPNDLLYYIKLHGYNNVTVVTIKY